MEALIDDLIKYVIQTLGKNKLFHGIDATYLKQFVVRLVEETKIKMERANLTKMIDFIKNSQIFQQCIIPNFIKIYQDNKVDMQDIPYFLDLIYNIYREIDDFAQNHKTLEITSNDLIEITGLLLKMVLIISFNDPSRINLGLSLIDNSLKIVKLQIKVKRVRCQCCC
ncbi:MAG: hypothetical protein ABIN35_00750 [candidate division WOR-3 bacterium]